MFCSANLMGQVTYTVTVPNGTNACFIAGEMTGWNQLQMTQQSTNVFTITIPYATTAQQYKYCSGPAWNFTEVSAGGGNVSNRTYSVSDVVVRWAIVWNFTNNIVPTVSSGSIERHWFTSDIVDDRYVDVWLPSGYSASSRYNVLYMHDGQMLFDSSTTWNGQEWNVDGILGSLYASGTIDKTIVVAIHSNGNKRHAEYFPEKVIESIPEPQKSQLGALFYGTTRADDYLKFIVNELKPYIDQNYSTNPGQQSTFMAGSSMGGLISIYALCEYPNVFSRVACLSTHWIGTFADNTQIPAAINDYLSQNLPSPTDRKIYFDHGSVGLDGYYGTYQAIVDNTMNEKGYGSSAYSSLIFEGADHNENAWKARFSIPATFILSNTLSSVSSIEKDSDLKLYPNPTKGEIYLNTKEEFDQTNVSIYDNSGKIIKKNIISNAIDVSNLNVGFYYFYIGNQIIKFIKE